jgi:NAD(P)-dependent dehydrogenase (short-subunit alcohol dehydrogenase family)
MKKVAVITGASGNLGKSTVDKFIAGGYTVVGTTSPRQNKTTDSINGCELVQINLTDEEESARFIGDVVRKHGSIDVLVLTVGAFTMGNLDSTNGEELKKMYSLNFESAYFSARPAFKLMTSQPSGGKIIFIGSKPSLEPSAGKNSIAYSLSKSLLLKLSEFINAEGQGKKVSSTVIIPGTIDTPENRTAMPKSDFTNWVKPEAIADTIFLLTSEQGNTIQNETIKMWKD